MAEGFFSFFPPPTEEQVQAMKERHEKQHIQLEEFLHGFQRLFNELDEDQLRILKTMFSVAQGDQDHILEKWEGMISQLLSSKFNICITCEVNHEKELQAPPVSEPNKTTGVPDEPLPIFYELSDTDKELMKEYHLDDLRHEGTNELVGFVCTGINGMRGPCGMQYKSIEDRMLKSPEECSGCFVRMSQG